eukprot:1976924-Rhodomonas_salina.1
MSLSLPLCLPPSFPSLPPDTLGADAESVGSRMGRGGKVQVVVVGFNHGREDEQRVDCAVLSEICQ